jgi:succinate dehydrogenase / fumarate reductase cytochrome b subunit
MNRLSAFWNSSVGKKAVMAVTGIIGVLFVIGHMVGNLQVFQGADRLNAYGHLLHGPLNELVWGARVVLLLALVLHVVAAYQLTMQNRAARPIEYAVRTSQVSTLASRTLRWGGVLLLAFIIYHLLDLTIGTVNPAFQEGDVYANLLGSMRRP